ncbi:hypothetical protein R84B8_02409 [Treponema sp. R8-4-B8]
MDLIILADSIYKAAILIDSGRKGFAIRGKEQEGRISYEDGIERAMAVFQEAQISADPQALILAEYTFIYQEFQLCEKSDKDSINSLKRAIQFFDDAFLALQVVEDKALYQGTEKTIPHDSKYRVKGFPKDSFHIACSGHKTRIQNILKTPGLDPIEKALLKQRLANLSTAQTAYTEKQKEALAK